MGALKYISWADTTGYASAAKAYVRALVDAGVELTWTPMLLGQKRYEVQSLTDWPCAKLGPVCNRAIDYDRVVIHTVPEYYPALLGQERQAGRRVFGYTVWELEQLPAHWPAILNQLDGVLVPCHWNVEVFRRSGVTVPIHVVPHLSQFEDLATADATAHAAVQARLPASTTPRFVFYTVGHWSNRKAQHLLLEAYWQAFDADDAVLLIVKTTPQDSTHRERHWRHAFRRRFPTTARTLARLMQRVAKPAAVALITDDALSDAQMLALHEQGDCFVSLTRTEGWGMGAFEAARLGKPVVITGYGGQLDFLDPGSSHLVNYRLVPVHEPSAPSYDAAQRWAEADVGHAATLLRQVYENHSAACERAAQQAHRITEQFGKAAVVKAFIKAIA